MSQSNKDQEKIIIFVLGSICSGLGKGVFAASLGRILHSLSYNVIIKKIDGYLNVDAGTINPIEHGEVFVTQDGQEGDMDLGTYERFMDYEAKSHHIISAGRLLFNLLNEERKGDRLLGRTVEYFHFEDKIVEYIYNEAEGENHDIVICEIGGVTGDEENASILKAINKIPNKIVITLSYGMLLHNTMEYKAKPIIMALRTLLRNFTVNTDLLVLRSHNPLNDYEKKYFEKKIAHHFAKFNNKNNILYIPDLPSPYSVYEKILNNSECDFMKNLLELIHQRFPDKEKKVNLAEAQKSVGITQKVAQYHLYQNQPQKIKILLLGKYNDLLDSYTSVYHSVVHAAAYLNCPVELVSLKAETFPIEDIKQYQGVIMPGGFGYSKTDFLQDSIKIIRENNIPFLGICFGMQLAFLEALNNLCHIKATSGEFFSENSALKDNYVAAVDIVENWKKDFQENKIQGKIGGSMRLGSYHCQLKKNTQAYKAYQSEIISERHRHRYEINQNYVEAVEKQGYLFSGVCVENQLMEIMEYTPNDFFVTCQFHPELKSKIEHPHPLFVALIETIQNKKQ